MQAWENYMHICKRVCNVLVKIYHVYVMYMRITYPTNKLFLNFVWLIYLHFLILAHLLLTFCFIQSYISTDTKMFSLKFTQGYSILVVTIFHLNYHYIIIIHILFF